MEARSADGFLMLIRIVGRDGKAVPGEDLFPEMGQ